MIRQHKYRFAYKYVVTTNVLQRKFEHIPYSSSALHVNRLLSIPEKAVIPGG